MSLRFFPSRAPVFAQKRKTLSNNLRAAGFAPDAIASAFTSAEIDSRARAEELSLESLRRTLARPSTGNHRK